jgi:hypothetical protein
MTIGLALRAFAAFLIWNLLAWPVLPPVGRGSVSSDGILVEPGDASRSDP